MSVQVTVRRNITDRQSRASMRLGSDELSKPGVWTRPRNEQPASDSHSRPHAATGGKAGYASIRNAAQSSVRAATSLLNTVSAQSIYIDRHVKSTPSRQLHREVWQPPGSPLDKKASGGKQAIALEPSVWDASLFVGIEGLGVECSAWAVMVLLVNLLSLVAVP